MSDRLMREEHIQRLERDLATLKSTHRTETLRETITANEHRVTTELQEIAAQKAELAGLLDGVDGAQEVLFVTYPELKAVMGSLLGRSDTEFAVPQAENSEQTSEPDPSTGFYKQSDDENGEDASYHDEDPARAGARVSTRNAALASDASLEGPAQATATVEKLNQKMTNVYLDNQNKILAIACHLCFANMSNSSDDTTRFTINGLRIHYNKSHGKAQMDLSEVSDVCMKTYLTEQDIDDILSDRKPNNPELHGRRKGKNKSARDSQPNAAALFNRNAAPAHYLALPFSPNGTNTVNDAGPSAAAANLHTNRAASAGVSATAPGAQPDLTPDQQLGTYNRLAHRAAGKRKLSTECVEQEVAESPKKQSRTVL